MSDLPASPSVPAARTSKAAVISLIFGILFCIPVISPLIALIAGFAGLSATKRPGVKGRGMAIVGIILGFLGLAATAGEGVVGYTVYIVGHKIVAALQSQDGLFREVSSGDYAAALARCSSNVSRDDLVKVHDQIADLGAFGSATVTRSETVAVGAGKALNISGILHFEKGTKNFQVRLLVSPDATFKVDDIEVTD